MSEGPEPAEPVEALATTIAEFTRSSDRYSKQLIRLTWALIGLTVVLIFLAVWTVKDARQSASLQNNIALNGQFFSQSTLKIIEAIDSGKPILKEHGGDVSPTELDTYLGNYDVIASAYDRGLLDEIDLCNSFSYYLDLTRMNGEISGYIKDQQKNDSGYFEAFSDLLKVVDRSSDPNCHPDAPLNKARHPRPR
jgi:hypothetical protein